MRPIFDADPPTFVITDDGHIPWDADNNRPCDDAGEAGRIYRHALADNGMIAPDPAVPQPAPRRRIAKSVVVQRLHAAGKLYAAKAALDSNI